MALTTTANIYKADGTKVRLSAIKTGDLLLSVADGHLIESPVISKEIRPARSDWLKLSGPRIGYARGTARFALLASPDQKLGLEGFTASDCVDKAFSSPAIFDSLALTKVQKSILLGILLGDGTLKTAGAAGGSKALKWVHSAKQEEYLNWTIQALGGLAKRTHDDVSGYGSVIHTAMTVFHPDIEKALGGFDKPSGKIPDWVANKLDPIAMAYWYMDDGSLTHKENQRDRVSFSTYSFSTNSHKILQAGLEKFGIDSVMQESAKGPTIRLNSESADLFFCLISPYVPPSMQYKLPEYYRGNTGWIPSSTFGYKKIIIDATIDSCEPFEVSRATLGREYILTTESGNFFSNGMLLSN
jgi:recombination protein RecA